MGKLILRSFLVSFLLSIPLSLGFGILGGYLVYTAGSQGLAAIEGSTRNTGLELGSALARMAGERLSKDQSVELSATMAQSVQRSRQKSALNQGSVVVQEIFLLDPAGRVLAHSDVARMAKNAQTDYNTPEYKSVLRLNDRHPSIPYETKTLESVAIAPAGLYDSVRSVSPEAYHFLETNFPEKVVTRYRLSIAVMKVDEEYASAGLHLIVKSESVNQYITGLRQLGQNGLIIALASIFLVIGSLLLVLLLVFGHPMVDLEKKSRQVKQLTAMMDLPEVYATEKPPAPANTGLEAMTDNGDETQHPEDNDGPTATELEIMAMQAGPDSDRQQSVPEQESTEHNPVPPRHNGKDLNGHPVSEPEAVSPWQYERSFQYQPKQPAEVPVYDAIPLEQNEPADSMIEPGQQRTNFF
ncbi:MAG: hypothetical protein KDK39_09335 [Leptospiraceae bacterium]|nr:hypothetical protein [Leptospiraceae bacterium]